MKRFIKSMVGILVITTAMVGSMCGMRYLLIDDYDTVSRETMHDFYNQENIDLLVIGASHCMEGMMPAIIDEETGIETFVASTASQSADTSYTLLKEAVQLYDVKDVYLDVSPTTNNMPFKERTNLTGVYYVADYMNVNFNKFELLFHASRFGKHVCSFFPARRYWDKVTDFSYIKDVINKKKTEEYKNYTSSRYSGKERYYEAKGYIHNDKVVQDHENFALLVDTDKFTGISEDRIRYIHKMMEVCDKNGIRLHLFLVPVSDFQINVLGYMDEYTQSIRDMIAGTNVDFVNFDLLKRDYFSYQQSYFCNEDHMNVNGAEAFSHVFADYINGVFGKQEETPEFYYTSYVERINSVEPYYYGVSYEKEDFACRLHLISNAPGYFEYRVSVELVDGSVYLLQDFDKNQEILYGRPQEDIARVIVEYR